jgi:hypothetical protein
VQMEAARHRQGIRCDIRAAGLGLRTMAEHVHIVNGDFTVVSRRRCIQTWKRDGYSNEHTCLEDITNQFMAIYFSALRAITIGKTKFYEQIETVKEYPVVRSF